MAESTNLKGDLRPVLLQTVLQQPLHFEVVIAFALAMQRLHHFKDNRMSQAILYHVNHVTVALRQRLLFEKDAISDEVILTIASLACIAVRTISFTFCSSLTFPAYHRRI